MENNLFKQLEDVICLGYKISFEQIVNQLCIKLEKNDISKESWLPISDHFYEKKVIDCIDFMMDEIEKIEKIK